MPRVKKKSASTKAGTSKLRSSKESASVREEEAKTTGSEETLRKQPTEDHKEDEKQPEHSSEEEGAAGKKVEEPQEPEKVEEPQEPEKVAEPQEPEKVEEPQEPEKVEKPQEPEKEKEKEKEKEEEEEEKEHIEKHEEPEPLAEAPCRPSLAVQPKKTSVSPPSVIPEEPEQLKEKDKKPQRITKGHEVVSTRKADSLNGGVAKQPQLREEIEQQLQQQKPQKIVKIGRSAPSIDIKSEDTFIGGVVSSIRSWWWGGDTSTDPAKDPAKEEEEECIVFSAFDSVRFMGRIVPVLIVAYKKNRIQVWNVEKLNDITLMYYIHRMSTSVRVARIIHFSDPKCEDVVLGYIGSDSITFL